MNWLRLYTTVLDNPKLQKLSGDHFKIVVNLWCLASIYNGVLPHISDVAFRLRCTEEVAADLIDELIEKRILDRTPDGVVPHDWSEHQYISDTSATRVSKYRQRTRDAGSIVGAYLKHKVLVFDRDNHCCVYCGSVQNLCLDHMVPILMGGGDEPSNLCACCKGCNSGKAGRTPDQAGYRFLNTVTEKLYRFELQKMCNSDRAVTDEKSVTVQNRTEQIQSRTEPPNPHAPEGACVNGVPTVKAMLPLIRKSRKAKRTTEEIRAALGEERGKWWDAFWDVFPCHDGMNEGMNAFEVRVRDHDLAVLVYKGAKSYRAKCDADPTIKVKFAQGWINSERWLDENNLSAVMPRPQQKSFIDDVQRVIGERIANGEKPW